MGDCTPNSSFTPREITGAPSSERTAFFKARYLEAPLMVDIEYIRLLTESHRRTDGMEVLERRAEDHAYALEGLTPVIHARDRIAGNKTRFIRGAIPYANYAAGPFLRGDRQGAAGRPAEASSSRARAAASPRRTRGPRRRGSGLLRQVPHLAGGPDGVHRHLRVLGRQVHDGRGGPALEARVPPGPVHRGRLGDRALHGAARPVPRGAAHPRLRDGRGQGVRRDPRRDRRPDFGLRARVDPGCPEAPLLARGPARPGGALRFAQNYAARGRAAGPAEADPGARASSWRWRRSAGAFRRCRRATSARPCSPSGSPTCWATSRARTWATPPAASTRCCSRTTADGAGFDEAVSLFEELFVKMTQIEYIASMSWQGLGHGNLYQNLILGGARRGREPGRQRAVAGHPAGADQHADDPADAVGLVRRQPLGRVPAQGPRVREDRRRLPGLLQPEDLRGARTARRAAFPWRSIRKHAAMGGCTEPVLQGMSYGVVQAGFVNHGKLIDLTMNDGVDPVTGIRLFDPRPVASYEDVEASYLDKMHAAVRNWQQYWNYVMVAHRETVPLVFCSVFVRDCLSRGLCMDDGGAVKNRTPTTLSSGLVNVANSLAAIRKLCFDDEVCTLDELRRAVAADWEGHEIAAQAGARRAQVGQRRRLRRRHLPRALRRLLPLGRAARTTTWDAPTTRRCWPSRRRCRSARPARPSPTAGAPASRWPTASPRPSRAPTRTARPP